MMIGHINQMNPYRRSLNGEVFDRDIHHVIVKKWITISIDANAFGIIGDGSAIAIQSDIAVVNLDDFVDGFGGIEGAGQGAEVPCAYCRTVITR